MSVTKILFAGVLAIAASAPAQAVTTLTVSFAGPTGTSNVASVTRSATSGATSLTVVATPRLFFALPSTLTGLSATRAAGEIQQTEPGIGVNGGASAPQLDTNNPGTAAAGLREGILVTGDAAFRITGLRLSFIDVDDTLQLYGVNADGSFVNLGYPGVITALVTTANAGLTQLDGAATTISTTANSGTAALTLATATPFFSSYFFTTRESGAVSYLGSLGQGYRIDAITASIPEPRSWALLVLGFAAVGAALRRRVAAGTGHRLMPEGAWDARLITFWRIIPTENCAKTG